MKILAAIVTGFLFSAFLVLYSAVLSGAGHGWNGALLYGLITLIACPMVAVSLVGNTDGYGMLAAAALLFGIIVDIFLVTSIINEFKYFLKVIWLAIPWITLMLFWQGLALFSIRRNLKATP